MLCLAAGNYRSENLYGGSEQSKANRLNKKGTVTVDSIYCKRLSLAERLISKVSIGGGACWTRDAVATEELEMPRL